MTIEKSASAAREQILVMQQWASTMTPKDNLRVQNLVQALYKTRSALEVLMVGNK